MVNTVLAASGSGNTDLLVLPFIGGMCIGIILLMLLIVVIYLVTWRREG